MKIYVNGRPVQVRRTSIRYRDIVEIAAMQREYTVTFTAPPGQLEGHLTPDAPVKLCEGMMFGCYHTGNA